MLIRTFVLKVINNERQELTHHQIIDRIAEQTASVIIQTSKELRIHSNIRRPCFSFTYSFKFTYVLFKLGFHSSYERY